MRFDFSLILVLLTHELDLFGEVIAHQPALNLGGDVVPNRQVHSRVAVQQRLETTDKKKEKKQRAKIASAVGRGWSIEEKEDSEAFIGRKRIFMKKHIQG